METAATAKAPLQHCQCRGRVLRAPCQAEPCPEGRPRNLLLVSVSRLSRALLRRDSGIQAGAAAPRTRAPSARARTGSAGVRTERRKDHSAAVHREGTAATPAAALVGNALGGAGVGGT